MAEERLGKLEDRVNLDKPQQRCPQRDVYPDSSGQKRCKTKAKRKPQKNQVKNNFLCTRDSNTIKRLIIVRNRSLCSQADDIIEGRNPANQESPSSETSF